MKRYMLHEFKGMSGVAKKSVFGPIIGSQSAARLALKRFRIVSAAGDRGCLNIWIDDDERFRCEHQVYMSTKDFKIFTLKKDAIDWFKRKLSKIK